MVEEEEKNNTPNPLSREWEEVSKMPSFGEMARQNLADNVEKDHIQDNLAEIRTIIDTETIAKNKDPEGLAEAHAKDQSILASCAARSKELEDKIAEYQELSKQRDDYLKNGGGYSKLLKAKANREKSHAHKVLAFFHMPDKELNGINAEIAEGKNRDERLFELRSGGYSNNETIETRRKTIEDTAKTATNEEEFLANFETPLNREQKERLLDYDTLANLSTDEYLQLWRHLNPQYVSHVTRQGYRDHSGFSYHTAGLGEMTKCFADVLKSNKTIRPSVYLKSGASKSEILNDEEAFRSYMEKALFTEGIPESLLESDSLSPNDIAEIIGGGHNILSNPNGFWRDRTAVHVAANNVLDSHYGAESGNEIFYIFPADVILSQNSTNNNLIQKHSIDGADKVVKIGDSERVIPHTDEDDHNDTSIYVQDGLPLDAGLVFLPKSVLVNPNTGSKYQSFDSKTTTGTIITKETGGIPAKEYWENYFKEHPEEKPAHIIYYDGEPIKAVNQTLAKNGIYLGNHGDTSGETEQSLGFNDKIACGGTESDKQLNKEAQEFFAKVADYIRLKKN